MLNQILIPEFTQEAGSTKRMLKKVPFDSYDWQPHGKSMALGKLADHVANTPKWATLILTTDEYDFTTGLYKETRATADHSAVDMFETNYQKALETLQQATDEALMTKWTLRGGDHVFFTLPRLAAIRTLAMNHLVHHRGQLSVYLRLLDVPVPGMYGPSADEQ